jgi:Tfp pilus assembly protein PilF
MARYMILSKQFSEAEKNARLAVESDPLKTVSQKNLAHSILYQGKYNEAEAYYKEFKNDADIREQILLDFDEFEQAGITDPGVAKIRVLLEN